MASHTSTITQGPLAYDKPKGLAALLVPILCPPTDLLDMQRLLRGIIKAFVRLSAVLVTLSFLVVPAWLWLIRHEAAIGHTGDAVGIAVGGLLLLLAADATHRAVSSSEAKLQSSLITPNAKLATQLAQRYAAAFGNTAAPAAAGASATSTPGRSHTHHHHHHHHHQQDPLLREVKQRIIRLEGLVFGNELREADLSPDALHGRVQLLCTEVGVPFNGSGARPSTAELDRQLRVLEKELLGA
ncbi:hypothetical protein GPECTOR_17g786 [Gonium pectorale]|uniref:Uncharacterized protein n=1 Tax=Gonium pectorale TaxID=33097 RepID=A0A150GLG5_GONPE|nr:hypothetical protein GPECTOR_17g786 [Gonium pectorale]|eukprot:KXZ50150.1 hypothetical protein GPECTOR_17g786 [Gonium pectorale]